MTERDKRIQEMAQSGSIVCKGCDCTKCANCVHYNRAKELYDTGYRKADEVRKETAKNIFKALDEIIAKSENADDILLYGKNFSKTGIIHRRFYVYKKDIKTLKEKFGAEVEE